MINALLVDDEAKAIVLRKQLKIHCPEINVVAEAQRISEAIKMVELHHPQLVFLDIEMSGGSGFDLLEQIQDRNFHVIFVTAHSEFAIKAFRFSVTDYLLKPVNREVLKQAVEKVKNLVDKSASASMQTLRIPSTGGGAFVYITDIIRMTAEGPYTHIYLNEGKHYLSSHNLKQFEEHLDSNSFLRIHRSHLINRAKVRSVSDREGALLIEMTDDVIIEVPRRNKQEILKMLQMKK